MVRNPRVLVACEFSGVVRDAFRAQGCDAWSCDFLPTEVPGPHHQGDIMSFIHWDWDLMVAFPPCTYLCNMGVWWNHKRPERWGLTEEAVRFFKTLWEWPIIPHIAMENPIGILSTKIRKPDQIIQPWQFGHEATKATCLWLKNLPPLLSTQVVEKGEFYTKKNGNRMAKWSHITSGTRKEERARIASRTFKGVAEAMAAQWAPVVRGAVS